MQKYSLNQIAPVILTVLGLLLAIPMGRYVAQGQLLIPGMIIGAIFGTIFFLTLGRVYWYMIPFALASNLPAVPLGGRTIELGELFIAACTAIFVARLTLKHERLVLFRATHIPLLLSFAWILLVFFLNPTGLIFFGSETIGGRYYVKILLAFCAFVVLASQQPTAKDFERIILLVFLGVLAGTALSLFKAFFLGIRGDAELSLDAYSWHQVLAEPALVGTWYLFARYKTSDLFSAQRPWGALLYLLAVAIATMSGKRMGLALVLVAPFLGAFLHKEYGKIWLGALLGIVTTSILVMGQGTFFNLPFSAQRALSWIPADWEPGLKDLGTRDTFREQLRDWAWRAIKESPWIGKGYALNLGEVSLGISMTEGNVQGDSIQTLSYAIAKNWHNRWLGYTADFGIPYTAMLPFLYGVALIVSFRLARGLPYQSGQSIFAFYAFFLVVKLIATSHTSGHSGLDAFNTWWAYGLLYALYEQYSSSSSSKELVTTPRNAQPNLDNETRKTSSCG